jgi:hypothetical protein
MSACVYVDWLLSTNSRILVTNTPSIRNYKSFWLFWYIHFVMYLGTSTNKILKGRSWHRYVAAIWRVESWLDGKEKISCMIASAKWPSYSMTPSAQHRQLAYAMRCKPCISAYYLAIYIQREEDSRIMTRTDLFICICLHAAKFKMTTYIQDIYWLIQINLIIQWR